MSTEKRRAYTVLDEEEPAHVGAPEPARNPWALARVTYVNEEAHLPARIVLVFPSGDSLGLPFSMVDELRTATPGQLATLQLSPAGDTIICQACDAYISVEGLIGDYVRREAGFADRVKRLSAMLLGSKTSASKRLAAVANGKKGGRPRRSVAALPLADDSLVLP